MRSLRLLVRWSWRDLRAHWAKVIAIALVIAIGTGGYAGLTSTANWRRASYEASYALLDMYDVRIRLATDSYASGGRLEAAALSIEHADAIAAVEERLIYPAQVDASTETEAILVRGQIVGTDLGGGGPEVNGYYADRGRLLTGADAGADLVMLERNFANFYDLPDSGSISVSGGRSLGYVGQALTPEYYAVAPEGEIFLSEANFAALFTSLETAQRLADRPGAVNDVVLTLVDGADLETVVAELEGAFESALPVGVSVGTREDNTGYTALTRDVDNDQKVFNLFALLLFVGAVGAAFNLITRLAEQQRREIGIAMALGMPPRQIALRPMLVSAQIALLGVVFGIGMGALIGSAMIGALQEFLPLPIWQAPFQTGVFAVAAAIGFLVPFVATAYPVWRAVRVKPVNAIKPIHVAGRASRGPRFRRLRGSTLAWMPVRNLYRARRRTVLTAFAIAAVMTIVVGFLGMLDSFFATIDKAEAEAIGDAPDRIVVDLDGVYPVASPEVTAVAAAASVGEADTTIRVPGTLIADSEEFDVLLEVVDLDGGMWRPTVEGAFDPATPGLVLAEEAARDLGVGIGDPVTLRHPYRTGATAFGFVETELPVAAVHPYPIRPYTYIDLDHADLLGLAGATNSIHVRPAAGATADDVERELFGLDAVASVQTVTAATQAVRDQMEQFIGVLETIVLAVLALALLIAFNTASINLDARSRDHATMFAFGVKLRTALRMAIVESMIIGIIATGIGIAGGFAMLWWTTSQLLSNTLPELAIGITVQGETLLTTIVLGIMVVALAPVFTVRRMRRMDVPGTLRLME